MIGIKNLRWAPAGALIIDDLTLELEPGTTTALLGPSGCGKSSLLRLLAGLRTPDGGAITGLPERRAFVFQDACLLPWATTLDNVNLAAQVAGIEHRRGPVRQGATDALQQLGLSLHAGLLPSRLSGGQRMRASLARALVSDPQIVFLDEALSALDPHTRQVTRKLFLRLAARHRWTVVMVTHDSEDAALMADRILQFEGPPLRLRSDTLNQRGHAPAGLPATRSFDRPVGAPTAPIPLFDPEPPAPPPAPAPPRPAPPLIPALSILAGIGLWALLAAKLGPFLLPTPWAVGAAIASDPAQLLTAAGTTLAAAAAGFLIAALLASAAASLSWANAPIRLALAPWITLLQILPIIAIAPMLTIWLGYGGQVAAVTAAVAAFYPIYSAAGTGLRAPGEDLVDLLRLYGASRLQEWRLLRARASLPALFSGLRTAAGLSVIGAMVGEFTGSNGSPPSLGFLILFGTRSARLDLSFAAILLSGVLAVGLQQLIGWAERRSIGAWYGTAAPRATG